MNVPNFGVQLSPSEPLARLGDTEEGLSPTEAEARLKRFGAKEWATARGISLGFQFFKLFANPLVLILLIASGLSACLGEVLSPSIIVLLGIGLDFPRTYRSQRAIERLRQRGRPHGDRAPRWEVAGSPPVGPRSRRHHSTRRGRPRAGRCAAAPLEGSLRSAVRAHGRTEVNSPRADLDPPEAHVQPLTSRGSVS
jgi:hypothetical protein